MPLPKILWVSDSPEIQQVGQSRVTREICYRLHEMGYPIEVAGYMPDEDVFRTNPITAFPIHNWKRFETQKLIEIIDKVDPEIIVLSHDIFMFNCLKHLRHIYGRKHQVIGYFTVDGEPMSHIFREILYLCDHVVSPTNYGKKVIAERFFDIPISVIPYAVNTNLYKCGDKEKARREFQNGLNFGHEKIDFSGKKVYLYVGNNQGRKNVGVARDAFKNFADKHPDEVLFLVIMKSLIVPFADFKYIGYYDLSEFLHPAIRVIGQDLSDEIIAKLYNISDFLIHPSTGEGFGLTLMEAMNSKCIPITTDFAAATDFCTDRTSLLLKRYVKMIGDFDTYRGIVDQHELEEVLEHSFNLEDIEWYHQNGLEMVKNYSWEKCVQQFHNLFEDLMEKRKTVSTQLRVCRL